MFRRRAGLGGLRIVVGPMRREDPATGAGAGGTDPAAGGGTATPPPPTGSTPPVVVPAPVDVTQSVEFKTALAQARAEAEARARTGSKDNARAEVLDQIAQALGIKPKDVDPAQVGADLVAARAENARLQQQIAVGAAARAAGGDEEMVTAWLSHKGKLKDLDPSAADFTAKIEALVKAEIEANPRLKSVPVTSGPPQGAGTGGPGSSAMGGGANGGGRERVLGLANALAAHQAR